MKKVIVIDPDCRNEKSHNMLATYRACLAAKASGFPVDAIVNRIFPTANLLLDDICGTVTREWPTFAFNEEDDPASPNVTTFHDVYDGVRSRWEKFHYALLDLHQRAHVDADTVLFMHTTSAPALMGILQYLLALDPERRPQFYCLLYCTHEIIQGPQLPGVSNLKVLERLRDENLIGTSVFFHVETTGLQEHYNRLGFDFPVVMGPLDQLEDSTAQAPAATGRKVVSFLGEAREEKGFHLVPDIIEAMHRLNPGHDIEYRIQTYSNPTNATATTLDAVARVIALQDAGVPIVVLGELTKDVFSDELKASHVMLMPYDAEAYRARGSGVVYDSLMFGARVVCTPGTDIHKTFADYGVTVPETPDAKGFATEILRVIGNNNAPDISGLQKYNIDNFFDTLFAVHAPTTRSLPAVTTQGRCLHGLVLPVDGGHGFVERAQIKMLDTLGMHRLIFGIPWVNGLDGMAYFRDHFIEFYFASPETRGAVICFPEVIDDAGFREMFAMYHDGRASVYSQETFQRLVSKYVNCGPVLEALLKVSPVDSALLNYAWIAPMVDKIRAAQPDTPVRMACEVHDYQSQQNIFRREAFSTAHNLEWSNQNITADLESETRVEIQALTRFDHNIYISDTLRGQLQPPGSKGDQVIYPPNINFPDISDQTATTDLELDPKVIDYICKNGFPNVDLLFVGTAHEANRASLVFLLDEVMPQARAKGPVTLFIVGNINGLFSKAQQTQYAAEGSFFIGRVDDINAWYMAARVVSLAVTQGTGFPTKVIETLSLGQCFSATSAAFYELARAAGRKFNVAKTSREMARDITTLLASPAKRAKRGKVGRQFYDKHFSQQNYIRQWSEALAVRALTPPHEPMLAHREADGPFHETFLASTLPLTLDRIDLSRAETGLFGDWSHPETQYRWIDGDMGRIILFTPARVLITAATFLARLSEAVLEDGARIVVTVNGTTLGESRVSHIFDHYTIESEDGIWVEGVVDINLHCPQGMPLGLDMRNLSTLFKFIEFDFFENAEDRRPPLDKLHAEREFDLEGPYPQFAIERQFTWVGRGGLHLTRGHKGEFKGRLKIEGFTDLSHQVIEIRTDEGQVETIQITEDVTARTEFSVEVDVQATQLELTATHVGQFPPPDNRVTGMAVYNMTLDGDPVPWG